MYHGKTDVRYLPALCVYRNSQFSSAEFACKLHTGTDLTGVECSRHASAQEGICSKGIWFYWRNHAAFVQNVDKILDLQSIEKSFLTLSQMGTSLGPHLISLLRGARWEGAPGSAGAGAVAADRRRAIARSRRLSSALSAARAAGGHRAAHREYGDVPLERSAAAVHAQTGCLSSWPELASPDREGVRRVGQMGGQRVEGLSGAAWSCCFGGRAGSRIIAWVGPWRLCR